MRAYLSVPAQPGPHQRWFVLAIDEDRQCEACEVHDSFEQCLEQVARLNALNRRRPAPRKQRIAAG